jgi:DNA-binding CsgD family transcriptional regulator
MALSTFDHNDLVLTLFEGLFAPEPWDTFLARLLARTRAQRIVLAGAGAERRMAERGFIPADPAAERAALAAIAAPGLRANRVYALEELLDFDDPARRERQDGLLGAARIGDARLIRVSGAEGHSFAVSLLHERTVFGAAESALLTALVPAIGIAAANLAAIRAQRLRLDAAEDALGRFGIGQAVLDRAGQPLAADARWQAHPPAPGTLAEPGQPIDASRKVVRAEGPGGETVLFRPLTHSGARPGAEPPVTVAALRRPRAADPVAAARIIAAELGLSPREAALAALLAQGHALIEAGRLLHLTPETARNYSKRIYAKTGTSGQADLVRLVLQGLSGLA